MLFYLIAGHFFADYPLQSDAIAACKCRKSIHPAAKGVPWFYWLTAHCIVHGAVVGMILRWYGVPEHLATGLAVAEFVVHWVIDLAKCEKWFGIHVDQGLHVLCKLLWWILLVTGTLA
jgi:Protein of unknown function (DUF3307)